MPESRPRARRLTWHQKHVLVLEKRLAPYLSPGFFFVNIGANDGIASDPIYPLVRKYGARGLFVEPVPYVFERLRNNYRDFEGMIFENAAIAATPRTFWYVEEGSGSMDYMVSQIGSLDREHLLGTIDKLRQMGDAPPRIPPLPLDDPNTPPPHEGEQITENIEAFVRELAVECVTFNDLMERHRIENIDFLNLDTEGFDFEIYHSINFERYRPTVLCIETIAFPKGGLEEVEGDLFARGYRFVQPFGFHSRVYAHKPA